ncbi:phage holin family protein [Hespellia stercorisuis]|uniref:Phage holin family Hol44, holin superfamily V n=1 Tax=Hespellia stercorisuis DSM 15480 TaxID=1121950 RepID=A0A1M6TRG7_9FIRM|nr:phage holin family protein [Hespellia stercorisuis]SHK59510.1 Phage holin family Hol44, holin superfamily V [Hespellia stercorisuis DSM 15480]
MDLGNLSDYYIVIVVLACLVVGYCIKNITWLDAVSNEYIPMIMAILGAVLGCIAKGHLSLDNIVYGALSGLASTGLHQMFKRTIHCMGEKREDGK